MDEYTRDKEKNSITTRTEIKNGLFGPARVVKKDETNRVIVDYNYDYNNLGQVTTFRQAVQNGTDYKHYSVTMAYDLVGNIDIIRPWEGEPGSTLIKALDYDPVVEDTEAAMASAVYEHTAPGRGAVIARTTAHQWGGIETVQYGDDGNGDPVLTTRYEYNEMLQPVSISAGSLMALSYTYDYQGNVIEWINGGDRKNYTYNGVYKMISKEKQGNKS